MFSIVDDDTLLHVGTVNHRAWHADHDGRKNGPGGTVSMAISYDGTEIFLMPTVYIHLLLHVTSWNA